MASSSQRSENELIELLNANIDMSPEELKKLINAGSSPMSQEEVDKLMNTVVHFDLEDVTNRINKAKARGDSTVLVNLFPQPSQLTTDARPKRNARSKQTCSGPTTNR